MSVIIKDVNEEEQGQEGKGKMKNMKRMWKKKKWKKKREEGKERNSRGKYYPYQQKKRKRVHSKSFRTPKFNSTRNNKQITRKKKT